MRVAVVTGGNRGLGKEICSQLSECGFQVILTARDVHKARNAVDELQYKGSVVPYQLDITSKESIDRLKDFVIGSYNKIDVLVNNAGIYLDNQRNSHFTGLFDMEIELLHMMLDVNVCGALQVTKAFVPYMLRQNYGRIVNVSSGMGRLTTLEADKNRGTERDPRNGPYYRISKAALNALTRIMAAEVYGHNILINAVCPGWVRTDMGGENAIRSVKEGAQGIIWAATLPDQGPSGGFFRDGKSLGW